MNKILLFSTGLILGFEAYLLATQPSNRQTFHNNLGFGQKLLGLSCCCAGKQILRILLISLLATSSYCLIFAENLFIGIIGQIFWMIFQINYCNCDLSNLRNIGIQVFMLMIILNVCKSANCNNAKVAQAVKEVKQLQKKENKQKNSKKPQQESPNKQVKSSKPKKNQKNK